MTSWLIGHSTIWRAAVEGAAVNDWLGMYSYSDWNVRFGRNFGGSPYTSAERMKAYLEQSPISYTGKIRTPTLILGDVGDTDVPITQSYSFYRALKDSQVETEFIATPISDHSPSDPVRREETMANWIHWLRRYLPTTPGSEAPQPLPILEHPE